MPDLPYHVVFETAFGYPAQSFVLRIGHAGDDDAPSAYVYTDRSGMIRGSIGNVDANPFRAGDPTLLFSVPPRLAAGDLTDLLVDLWHIPQAQDLRARLVRAGRRTGRHPLHSWSRPARSSTHHRLQLDYWYDVSADWAFPYCLRPHGEDTRTFPLWLGPSRVRGREVSLASDRREIKFVRDGDRYLTIVRRGGVERTLAPQGLPARRDGDTLRPRVVLPHTGGLVLLHKIFYMTAAAQHEMDAYRGARSYLQRDVFLLSRLARLYALSWGMCAPYGEDADQRIARGRIPSIHRRITDLQESIERKLEGLEEQARRSAGPLSWLAGPLWTDRSLASVWRTDWHQRDHALGPLSFLLAALWTVRDSPHDVTFHAAHGQALIQPPPRPRVRPTEAADAMVTNDAYGPPDATAPVSSCVELLGKSISVWTEANTFFAHLHAASLMQLQVTTGGRRPARITREAIEAFIEFATDAPAQRVRAHVDRVVRGSGQPYGPTHTWYRQRLERLQDFNRAASPRIGELVDGMTRVLAFVSIARSLQAERWDTDQLIELGTDVLGATDAGSILLGTTASQNVAKALGPIIAAADFGVAARDAHLAYVRGRDSDVWINGFKAGGAALIAAGYLLNAIPGAGPICIGAGTLVQVGAEVYGWAREHLRDDWAKEAVALHRMLLPDGELRDLNVHGTGGALWTEPGRRRASDRLVGIYGQYLRTVQAHVREKASFRTRTFTFGDQRPTLADVLHEDWLWPSFPEFRWRYLDRGEESARNGYVAHCRQLDSRWNPGRSGAEVATMRAQPSRPLPPPPPLPHDGPIPT